MHGLKTIVTVLAMMLPAVGIAAGPPDRVVSVNLCTDQLAMLLARPGQLISVSHLAADETISLMSAEAVGLRIVELQDPPRPWKTAEDYKEAVATWRRQRLDQWTHAVADNLADGQRGGFLVWGDPGLYESTLAIVKKLIAAVDADGGVPIELNVIPGISSSLSLASRHQIPLNRQGRALQISPARLLADGMPEGVDDVIVMLDGRRTFSLIDPTGIDIYWAAYIGTPDEILISGDLAEVREKILTARADAEQRLGWVFDTYLLRRR